MKPLDGATRANDLARMADEQFDVLVIGGGITGAGVALDAAARGYRVALVEKSDFASGTSSKSTKLVHGGIRYLPQYDFALVHEALVERGLLAQNAPFLVEPLAFVLPLYENAKRPLGVPFAPPNGIGLGLLLDAGLWLYDILAGSRNVGRHRRISLEEAEKRAPTLRREGLKEAFIYYDAQTNDTRLTMTVLRTAVQHGAAIANYAEVIGFTRGAENKLVGATVRDALTGATFTISARHIVNAAGIFAQRVTDLTGDESQVTIEPSKGVHLVVARERLKIGDSAIVLPETDDGRILFIVPWGPRALIGTTDTGRGDLDDPEATPEDISYLLRHVNRYLDVDLTYDDLLSTYAGYRPLVKPNAGNNKSASALSRTHIVVQEKNGMVVIVGGKLTTYRRMAQDTIDVLSRRDKMPFSHPTQRLLLSGAIDWRALKPKIAARAQSLGLSDDIVTHLEFNYGANASLVLDLIAENASLSERIASDLPYVRAEIIYICRYEMAMTLDDVLARRTRISLEDRDRGSGVANEIATLMAGELGWTQDQIQTEVELHTQQVHHQYAVEGIAQ